MYEKVTKKIKDKNEMMYELYNKAGDRYKVTTYDDWGHEEVNLIWEGSYIIPRHLSNTTM